MTTNVDVEKMKEVAEEKARQARLIEDLGLAVSEKGKVLIVRENVAKLLEAGDVDVRFDAFALKKVKRRVIWDHEHGTASGQEWSDRDTILACEHLHIIYGVNASTQLVHEAVELLSMRPGAQVHPVREYLNAAKWDGTSRVGSWLTAYCGVEPSEYAASVGACFMIGAVARVFEPGCKLDTALILEGPQGAFKSTALRTLAGSQWFFDSAIEFGSKDAYQSLRGRWICELAELDSLYRAESTRAKAYMSSPSDTYRPSYGRESVTVPRQCIFVGTTNSSQFLRDETGARRYWPVKVGHIDIEALARDRDQLWGEALHMYRQGRPWWLDAKVEDAARAEQETRQVNDEAWEEQISHWLEQAAGLGRFQSQGYLTTNDLLQGALGKTAAQSTPADAMRAGIAMIRGLGWNKRRVTANGRRLWVFEPKSGDPIRHVRVDCPTRPTSPDREGEAGHDERSETQASVLSV